ncbi:hypothetical protein DL93DRAFT_1121836 [Clavulina sp. PMI_390]|nr:hypothetical protein DL93DRAFT_1121836 [Clavulina sp. PMI_390]
MLIGPVDSSDIDELGYLSASGSSLPAHSLSLNGSLASWPSSALNLDPDSLMSEGPPFDSSQAFGSLFPHAPFNGNSNAAMIPEAITAASGSSATARDSHYHGFVTPSAASHPPAPSVTESFRALTLGVDHPINEGASAPAQSIDTTSASENILNFPATPTTQGAADFGGPTNYANPHGTGSDTSHLQESSATSSSASTASDLRIRSSLPTSTRFHPYPLLERNTNQDQNTGGLYNTDVESPVLLYDDGMYVWYMPS